MLDRQNRFHGYNSVLPVYKSAKTVRGDGCSLHYRLNPRRKTYRLAVVVSRKTAKSAVVRNRIRRRIYEIMRNRQISQPYDLIITVYDDKMATIKSASLEKIIDGLLRKSHITP